MLTPHGCRARCARRALLLVVLPCLRQTPVRAWCAERRRRRHRQRHMWQTADGTGSAARRRADVRCSTWAQAAARAAARVPATALHRCLACLARLAQRKHLIQAHRSERRGQRRVLHAACAEEGVHQRLRRTQAGVIGQAVRLRSTGGGGGGGGRRSGGGRAGNGPVTQCSAVQGGRAARWPALQQPRQGYRLRSCRRGAGRESRLGVRLTTRFGRWLGDCLACSMACTVRRATFSWHPPHLDSEVPALEPQGCARPPAVAGAGVQGGRVVVIAAAGTEGAERRDRAGQGVGQRGGVSGDRRCRQRPPRQQQQHRHHHGT